MHILGRRKIPHRRFQGFVTHPVLNRAYVESRAKHTGSIGGPESAKMKMRRGKLGTLSNRLALVQHVELAIATRRGEDKAAAILAWMNLKKFDQLLLYGHFPLFPSLR